MRVWASLRCVWCPAGDAALPGLRQLLPSAQRGGARQELLSGPPAEGLPHHFRTKLLLLFVPRPGECLTVFSTPSLACHKTPLALVFREKVRYLLESQESRGMQTRPRWSELTLARLGAANARTVSVLPNVSQRFSVFPADRFVAYDGFSVFRKESIEAGGGAVHVPAVASLCKQTSTSFIKMSPTGWGKNEAP